MIRAAALLAGVAMFAAPLRAAPADGAGARLAALLQTAVAACWNVDQKASIKLPVNFDNVVQTGLQGKTLKQLGQGLDPASLPVFPLIERFAKTQPVGRFGEPSMYVRMPNTDADVWIVYYKDYPGCEIAVANTKHVTEARSAVDVVFATPEWKRLGPPIPADVGTGPAFSKQIYTRDIVDAATPGRIVRVVVERMLAPSNEGKDLQFFLSVVDGQRKAAATAKDLK